MNQNRTKAHTTENTSGMTGRIAQRTILLCLMVSSWTTSFGAEVRNYDRGLAHPGAKHAMRYNRIKLSDPAHRR